MDWKLVPAKQLATLATHWDALQAKLLPHAFLRSDFLLCLLDQFGQGRELLAYREDDIGWTAALLLRPRGKGRWNSFQPSQLPMGPVLLPADEDLEAALQSLLRALPGLVLGVGLTQLDSLAHMGPFDGARLRHQHYIDTAWVDVENGFEAYWEGRGKNLRQNTRKQLKKIEATGVTPRLEMIDTPELVALAIKQYGMLENSGWKAELGTAISVDGAQGRFYRQALESAAAAGRARIYRYWFGDEVVAMDLCVHQDDCLVILKTAYQQAHQAVSPSTLMRAEEFKAVFDEGRFKRIEFFGRVMEWHTRWTDKSRPLMHLTAYRWAWLKALQDRLNRSKTRAA
ncbi:GNAT family N-acetyltransferase [Roseateles saccharophilus]|nr:GNAT family N-acetyltransferase [Roseateles saccharophilus]MDG0835171.1 GNAT family N-acetyltransferase [Roseateles saccharophilus]